MSADMQQMNARDLITPEGVNLKVYLADLGARVGAFTIDMFIIFGSLIALALTLGASGVAFESSGQIIFILGAFFLRSFYFMFFEMGRRAATPATPGKRICKIRVVARNEARLTANAVFARNALREIEIFLPLGFMATQSENIDGLISIIGLLWCLGFLFFPLFNKDRLRAGDLIAGTWVVKAPRPVLAKDLAGRTLLSHNFQFTPAQINAYGIHELHILEDIIRKNQPDILQDVAGRIRKKIDWQPNPAESDLKFLEAYYAALRGRLETQMLFGVRKKDKHDVKVQDKARPLQ